jgi:ATP-dependent RNA helicase SUPV3L1/SUV3
MLSITGMTLDQFADLMQGLGYRATRIERPKARPVAETAPASEPESVPETASTQAMCWREASDTAAPESGEQSATAAPEPLAVDPVVTEPAAPEAVAVAEAEADATHRIMRQTSRPWRRLLAKVRRPNLPPTELEVVYTFAWAGRARTDRNARGERPNRGPRREGGGRDATAPAEGGDTARPRGDRPREDRGKHASGNAGKPGDRPDRASKPKGQHKPGPKGDRPPRDSNRDGPRPERKFEAHPPRSDRPKSDRIDPDNPFAAALMGLRDKL